MNIYADNNNIKKANTFGIRVLTAAAVFLEKRLNKGLRSKYVLVICSFLHHVFLPSFNSASFLIKSIVLFFSLDYKIYCLIWLSFNFYFIYKKCARENILFFIKKM